MGGRGGFRLLRGKGRGLSRERDDDGIVWQLTHHNSESIYP